MTPVKGLTSYQYDAEGNLKLVAYPTATNTYSYDAMDELTAMTDSIGNTTYGYTAAGQLANEDGPWSSDSLSYSYEGRLRSSMVLAQPFGSSWQQTYAYDGGRRLLNTTSPAGTFGYSYGSLVSPASAGELVNKLLFPSGAYITNAYDTVGNLLSTSLKGSANNMLNQHVYAYDWARQRTEQTFTANNYIDYTYDNAGQLKTASGYEAAGTPRLHEQFTYNYDPAGNLTQRTKNNFTEAFSNNSLNEISNITKQAQAEPDNLRVGSKYSYGIYGFSVQSEHGKSIDELAKAGQFPNKQISVTTVNTLTMVGGILGYPIGVVKTPGEGYHKDVTVPENAPENFFQGLSRAFNRKPNAYPTPKS